MFVNGQKNMKIVNVFFSREFPVIQYNAHRIEVGPGRLCRKA